MFKFLVNLPNAFHGFASGILMSVATTAGSNVVLSERAPGNRDALLAIAIIALLASALWLILGEFTSRINRRIAENADALDGKPWVRTEAALDIVKRDTGPQLFGLVAVTVVVSLGWLFVA